MRDAARIQPFLKEVGELWAAARPDMRFGQLMYNFISAHGDPFYWEEDLFLEKFKEYLAPRES